MAETFQLPVERLRARVDPTTLGFETTREIAANVVFVGQRRAREALEFALSMRRDGYNVFVAGAPGTGKSSAVRAILDSFAPGKPVPSDWCYVHNFRNPSRPRALTLVAGQGRKLRESLATFVDNGDRSGAPVVVASNPTYPNLIGRIEREALLGALVTDFTLITAGALHQANGGYLVLRAEDLFRMPMAWDGLKRALRERAIAIEDVSEAIGMATARGLRPDPIPLDTKVIVVGEAAQYALLHALDPDFAELFRVRADFDTVFDRTLDTERELAHFAASTVRGEGPPLTADAVALIIEEASRSAADQEKLTARLDQIADLVREAA